MTQIHLPNIAPNDDDNDLPLPLVVARRWNFSLAYIQVEGSMVYAIQDWIRGLVDTKEAYKIWNDIQRKSNLLQLSASVRQFPYLASNGKTYQMDYATDKILYLIAQHLRATKSRQALASIKRFLAEAGVFVDQVRLDPNTIVSSGAMTPDQAIDAAIQAYRAQGKDDKWIRARIEGKIKRNLFTAALNAAVAEALSPRQYATATDDIYVGLWGRTSAYLKGELKLPKNANLRDHQPTLALDYQRIAEGVAAQKLGDRSELSWGEARSIVKTVANFIGQQARATSELLNTDLATGKPLLPA
jgi:hypothetical protein